MAAKGTLSQEDDIRPGACFYCGRAGHQVKDCWLKNKLCRRCGVTGHVMKNCTGDPSQQTANSRDCTHCGHTGHQLKNCRKWNGWCLWCGASNHLQKDCPERQGSVPTGPTGRSETADGPSQQGGKGKNVMRGNFYSYLHHT
ncbi:zf-CCHC domain-containing protein/zf-CCHC_4 domain-containing protein [Cephalotus follicularis]|uniref:Zf-CCHC domain-containing protein/zf-CCHC_4 domain-containing protein n=1 Tax=Cephalotus follicularis TaxID=3775 RepID=A0A1Q3BQ09_CEPFO|nr:zf-CCHC domain-containing protein/zf-CCHC_4 domain-containing protein [Cephalotus follicularis]